jgi:hypothetical protein
MLFRAGSHRAKALRVGVICVKNGLWLVIPIPAAGKSTKGGRMTPAKGNFAQVCACG